MVSVHFLFSNHILLVFQHLLDEGRFPCSLENKEKKPSSPRQEWYQKKQNCIMCNLLCHDQTDYWFLYVTNKWFLKRLTDHKINTAPFIFSNPYKYWVYGTMCSDVLVKEFSFSQIFFQLLLRVTSHASLVLSRYHDKRRLQQSPFWHVSRNSYK